MLLNPAILALLAVSATSTLLLLVAGAFGLQLVYHWDFDSGSERQLTLERRTYLISTLVAFCFLAEAASVLLFVYNAEQIAGQFVGAMCATGVLNVNSYGWPVLYLKLALFFAGAAWLTLNRVDNRAPNYPLVRIKYLLMLAILPLAVTELIVQSLFFLQLDPDIITSCCGSLFTPDGTGVAAELAGIQPVNALLLLIGSGLAMTATGAWVLWRQRGGMPFAASALAALVIALVAIVSLIALYIYEHPHHHCPFCILKSGHDFLGYFLYLPLFVATALALGVGAIAPFTHSDSLGTIVQHESRFLVSFSLVAMALFYTVATYAVLRSNLTMLEVWW